MSESISKQDQDQRPEDTLIELPKNDQRAAHPIDSVDVLSADITANTEDKRQSVSHANPEQRWEAQTDIMVRTIGQMRALIMDFPSSLIASNFFKAFSDGTRLRLLQALSIREMCVSDLCTLLELSQPAISNHLRVLNHQRIVKMRRSGKNIFYSLDDWHINAIIGMAMEHLSFNGNESR